VPSRLEKKGKKENVIKKQKEDKSKEGRSKTKESCDFHYLLPC